MTDLKLTPYLLSMLERIEKHSGTLLMLAVTASGGQDGKLNKLRGAGYVVKCDHPSVTEGAWPAEALAITEAGRAALVKHRAAIAAKKNCEAEINQKDRQRNASRSSNPGKASLACATLTPSACGGLVRTTRMINGMTMTNIGIASAT